VKEGDPANGYYDANNVPHTVLSSPTPQAGPLFPTHPIHVSIIVVVVVVIVIVVCHGHCIEREDILL